MAIKEGGGDKINGHVMPKMSKQMIFLIMVGGTVVPTQSYQQARPPLGLGKPFLERTRDFFSSLQINRS